MKAYVLDSNLYIEAAQNLEKAKELAAFTTARLPRLFFHAVVAQEIIAGATTTAWRTEIEKNILGPFERRGRLVTPSFRAWKRSGEIVSELIRKRRLPRGGVPRSFLNDVLLAASCREEGLTLVTKNEAHFELIADVEGVHFVPPWPKT